MPFEEGGKSREMIKTEFHPCFKCLGYLNDECNNEDYFKEVCATKKTISFNDISNFLEQLKEQNK